MSTYNLLGYQGKQSLPQGIYCQVGKGSCQQIAVMNRSTDKSWQFNLGIEGRFPGRVNAQAKSWKISQPVQKHWGIKWHDLKGWLQTVRFTKSWKEKKIKLKGGGLDGWGPEHSAEGLDLNCYSFPEESSIGRLGPGLIILVAAWRIHFRRAILELQRPHWWQW